MEDLPNELLHYVLQLLSAYDLHHGLYNLNARLNALCHEQKLHLDASCSKTAFDYYCRNRQPFSSQILSAKIDDQLDRMTVLNQYVDLERFVNLRALTIKEASPDNLGNAFV